MGTSSCFHVTEVEEIKRIVGEAMYENEVVGPDGSPVSGGGGGSSAWGGITGTLADQTDLQAALDAKQVVLVSASNIKTINGASILGSGDMSVALNTTVTLEHLPSTTAWAATITPASYVSRFGFSSDVSCRQHPDPIQQRCRS